MGHLVPRLPVIWLKKLSMDEVDILIVDDDESLRRQLIRYLGSEGYSVVGAENGASMREKLAEVTPVLIVLDLHLPDSHGLVLAREIRSESDIGIIILTGSDDDFDEIAGLELGADDYINKPVEKRMLLARIRSVLRRVELKANSPSTDPNKVATFSHLKLDFTAHQLTDEQSNEIKLTSQEYLMLVGFVEHANQVLSRDQLMDHMSGRDWVPSDRSIDVLVAKLRKKIEPDPSNPMLIKTIRGAGYIFTARVEMK